MKKKWRARLAKASRKAEILSTGDLQTLLEHLRGAGRQPSPRLLERIKEFGSDAVEPLLAMALDRRLHHAGERSPEVWAPLHAVRLLGELRAAAAAEALLPLFDQLDDWLADQLPETYARFGRAALAPLRAALFDRGRSTLARSGAAQALTRLAETHPELRADVVAALVARLDPAQTRTPEDEMTNADAVRALLDLKANEALSAIRQAFEEDRVDRMFVDYRAVVEAFGVPPEPRLERGGRERPERAMLLRLRCSACGFARDHWVERVFCDLGTVERRRRGEQTRYDEFVIAQRITCPKCGAIDRYELTEMGYLALTAELIARRHVEQTEGDAAAEQQSPLVLAHLTAAGREMHPYEARDWYQQQIETEPRDAALRIRYGNVLRTLGYTAEAMAQYREALALDPTHLEALANLADQLLGAAAQCAPVSPAAAAAHRAEARRLLERAVRDASDASVTPDELDRTLPPSKRDMLLSFAQETLEELDAGRSAFHPRLDAPWRPEPSP